MRRIVNLALFAVVALLIVGGLLWLFRGQVLRLAGVSFDTGPGQVGGLEVPSGYTVTPFATDLIGPRFMAIAPDGTLLVAERGNDRVVALPDRDGDGVADETVVVGSGYDDAHSLAFAADGTLYVAGTGTLFAVELGPDLRERSRRAILDLPAGGVHTTRTVAVLPDGRLLISVGSSCNVCWEEDPRRAAILIADADGSNSRVFMHGLRNAVGVAVDPATGTAWATVNGRDMLGDDVPPETLYRVEDGANAGWPRCHAGTIVDPDFGAEPDPTTGLVGCDGVVDAGGHLPGAHGAARHRLLGRPRLHRLPWLLEPLDEGRLRGRACALVRRWAGRRTGALPDRLPRRRQRRRQRSAGRPHRRQRRRALRLRRQGRRDLPGDRTP